MKTVDVIALVDELHIFIHLGGVLTVELKNLLQFLVTVQQEEDLTPILSHHCNFHFFRLIGTGVALLCNHFALLR